MTNTTTTRTDASRIAMNADVAAIRRVNMKAILRVARKHAMTVSEVMYVFCVSEPVAKFAAGAY